MDATDDWVREVDVDALARWYGTPLHVTSEPRLSHNLAVLAMAVGGPSGVVFPVKANPSPGVLRFLAARLCRADCASVHEVRLALAAGFSVDRLVCNSPAPDMNWLIRMWVEGAAVVADSPWILEELSRGTGHPGRPRAGRGKVFVRVNPPGEAGYAGATSWTRVVAHATPQGKFGIPAEDVAEVVKGYPIPIEGLHVHVGTQMDRLEVFVGARDLLHDLADAVRGETGHPVTTLDLGGGLGLPYAGSGGYPTREAYVEALVDGKRRDFDYWIEPGQALVGDAGALLTRVVSMKQMRGRTWAFCDVGSDQLMKASLLGWHHHVSRHGERLPVEGPDAVGGPLCFAGDIIVPATRLDGTGVGDLFMVESTGAYCFALANHFNGRLGPAHVSIGADGTVQRTLPAEEPAGDHATHG